MADFLGQRAEVPSPISRRQAIRLTGAATLGLAASARARESTAPEPADALILLLLVGGPSQLETFDPKPDAPAEVRGGGSSIPTAVPGVRLGSGLPGLARRMDRLAIVRSLHHDEAPIHETGFQLLQTGGLSRLGVDRPHLGSRAVELLGPRPGSSVPPFVVLPGSIVSTGVAVSHGQTAGSLGEDAAPHVLGASFDDPESISDAASSGLGLDLRSEPTRLVSAYGPTAFGRSCLLAARLVEAGARVVVVNMFDTVFGRATWDCHGRSPFRGPADVERDVAPAFDRAFSALVDDLSSRGLLGRTLVAACGEFGRTPMINAQGGRDHWTRAFSAVLAGGGVPGGLVIGATDSVGAEPVSDPVPLAAFSRFLGQRIGLENAGDVGRLGSIL